MLFWLRDITLMLSELRAASALHTRMLDAVMKAPMSFFDATPTGRILNRFSNDQESLDATLPRRSISSFRARCVWAGPSP